MAPPSVRPAPKSYRARARSPFHASSRDHHSNRRHATTIPRVVTRSPSHASSRDGTDQPNCFRSSSNFQARRCRLSIASGRRCRTTSERSAPQFCAVQQRMIAGGAFMGLSRFAPTQRVMLANWYRPPKNRVRFSAPPEHDAGSQSVRSRCQRSCANGSSSRNTGSHKYRAGCQVLGLA
jgi:hypothetical protein